VKRLGWLLLSALLCLCVACTESIGRRHRPDPTKGSVTGTVICSDTGKAARFATVLLTAVPKPIDQYTSSDPLKAEESEVTDLEGHFRINAVDPGEYYVFAWMQGYVDPVAGLNSSRLEGLADNRARQNDAIEQWKDHMVAVTVKASREVAVSLSIDRAAEITGKVTYEDGTPASNMHFDLRRRVDEKTWTKVGMMESNPWVFHSRSDSHGRYAITDLLPGEYKICALFPAYDDETPATWCLGQTDRFRDAEIIKLRAGEVTSDINFEIPLSGMYSIAGSVKAQPDNHPLTHGTIRLLYADDREVAREVDAFSDGGFAFDYVPEDGFILEFKDFTEEVPDPNVTTVQPGERKPTKTRHYTDREVRVDSRDDITDMTVTLSPMPFGATAPQTK